MNILCLIALTSLNAFSQTPTTAGYRTSWMPEIKSVKNLSTENIVGLRKQVLGFNSYPDVWQLGNNSVSINGSKYNTIRITPDSKAVFGKIEIFQGDLFLSETASKKFQVFPGSSHGIKGKVINIDGQVLEIYNDHVVIDGIKIDTEAYATYDSGIATLKPKAENVPKKILKTQTISSGIMNYLALANMVMMFTPMNNPFAEVVGHTCESLEKAKNRIICKFDSFLNPLNNVVNCSEILDYWPLKNLNDGCRSRFHFYSLRVDSEIGKRYLKDNGFFKKNGSAVLQNLKFVDKKKILKEKTKAKEFETTTTTFPQGEEYL